MENREQNAPAGRRMMLQRKQQGAKRRVAGAVSDEATERPMEPKAFRALNGVFAENRQGGEANL